MNAKLIELVERRTTLVARAATQRAELSQALAPWRRPLAVVDQGWVAVRYIRNHAALLAGVAAFVVPLRPLRVARWLRRGWLVWRMALVVKRILHWVVSSISRLPPAGLKSFNARATTANRLWATPGPGCYRPRARAEGFRTHPGTEDRIQRIHNLP